MIDAGWLDAALKAARPRVVGALMRQFRDLDLAEEAFQEAALRALRVWPVKGPPRDTVAWLAFVGRNAAVDLLRLRGREASLTPAHEEAGADRDGEADAADRIDGAAVTDDLLRLLFIAAHPALPETQRIALALRIVCGLTVPEIARAFLAGEAAVEQRITRAKARLATLAAPFELPPPEERRARSQAVGLMILLLYNQGYAEAGGSGPEPRQLTQEAIRLARHLLAALPADPEAMGLLALLLLTEARAGARHAADGAPVPLDAQDRSRFDRRLVAEGLALVGKASRHPAPGPMRLKAAIAAVHARASGASDTDWRVIAVLYGLLEQLEPSPVVTLNRAVAVMQTDGPAAALALVEPLSDALSGYPWFHASRGAYLARLGQPAAAREAFQTAVSLAGTAADAARIRAECERMTGL